MDQATYPMRVVTRLTGLNADTIRAWERRYDAVTPSRTDGNTRMYTADEVRRLTLLREVTELGHAIGRVAHLDAPALEGLLGETGRSEGETQGGALEEQLVARYLSAVSRFDARRSHDILARAAAFLTPRDFVLEVALPILDEVGRRWSHATLGVAQEHLVSSQLLALVGTFVRLHPADAGAPRVVATTLAGERHEFGVLIGALLAAARGADVIYLGPDLPHEEVRWAVEASHASVLLLSVLTSPAGDDLERLRGLLEGLPDRCEVWVGAPEGVTLYHPRLRRFSGYEAFEIALVDLLK